MNFKEIAPGVFVGIHMITHFEIIPSMTKGDAQLTLVIYVIGSGVIPAVEVVVANVEEAMQLLGLGAVSNLNLVRP